MGLSLRLFAAALAAALISELQACPGEGLRPLKGVVIGAFQGL